MATGDVFVAMCAEDDKYAPDKQVMDYVNLIGYKAKYCPPSEVPTWVILKSQGSINIKERG